MVSVLGNSDTGLNPIGLASNVIQEGHTLRPEGLDDLDSIDVEHPCLWAVTAKGPRCVSVQPGVQYTL